MSVIRQHTVLRPRPRAPPLHMGVADRLLRHPDVSGARLDCQGHQYGGRRDARGSQSQGGGGSQAGRRNSGQSGSRPGCLRSRRLTLPSNSRPSRTRPPMGRRQANSRIQSIRTSAWPRPLRAAPPRAALCILLFACPPTLVIRPIATSIIYLTKH